MSEDLYGYEVVAENQGGGKYLNLKSKGDKIKVRLMTKPLHNFRYWETGADGKQRPVTFPTREAIDEALKGYGKDDKPKIDVQYGWVVIDRADGEIKVFKGGQSIAGQIKGIIEDGWGDPTGFDMVITRTEEKPMYYKVTPVPNSNTPITDAEKQKFTDANIDLKDEMQGGGESKSHSEQYGGAVDLETLPEEQKAEPEATTETDKVDVEADDDSDLPF